jgi:hypothetical protein
MNLFCGLLSGESVKRISHEDITRILCHWFMQNAEGQVFYWYSIYWLAVYKIKNYIA